MIQTNYFSIFQSSRHGQLKKKECVELSPGFLLYGKRSCNLYRKRVIGILTLLIFGSKEDTAMKTEDPHGRHSHTHDPPG